MHFVTFAASRSVKQRAFAPNALALSIAATLGPGAPLVALAQTSEPGATAQAFREREYDIEGGPLDAVLNRFALEAGIDLSVSSELTEGKTSPGLEGRYSVNEALQRLLAGSGLTYRFTGADTVTLAKADAQDGDGPVQLGPITVEGDSPSRLGTAFYERDEGFKAEYQLSATKIPVPLRETPQSVSVVTRDLLEARQVITLGQALETAGVQIAREPGPFAGRDFFGTGSSLIRGIEAPPEFGVLQDGFSAPILRGTRDPAIFERIEVVKGPASVLYGRASAGGLINQITKKPLAERQAEFSGTVGSFDFKRVDADVAGALNDAGGARGRLVFAYEDSGSFIDFVESERVVAAPSLEFDLTETTRLLLQGNYEDDSFVPHHGFGLIREGEDFRAPNVRRSLFFGLPGDKDDNNRETLAGTVQIDQAIGDRWLATLRFNAQQLKQETSADSYAYGPYTAAGNTYQYSGVNFGEADLWSGEIRINGEIDLFNRPVTIGVGADRSHLEDDRSGGFAYVGSANIYQEDFDSLPAPAALIPYGNKQDFDGAGVYAQAQIRALDRVSLLLGGRYDWTDTFSDGDTIDTTIGTRKKDEEFTWRTGAVFDMTEQISVYGLYAQSFAPSIFAIGRNGVLDPETGETYEIGFKSEWFDKRLGITAALFRIERDDIAVRDPDNMPGENFSINSGVQRSDGFEVDIHGEPLPGWNLSFNGLILDSEFIEKDDPFFGNSARNTADWQVSLFTSYELQEGPFKGLGGGVGLFAIDERAVSPRRPGTIDGYERVDMQVFYNGVKNLNLSLSVRNVFDQKYVETLGQFGSLNQFGAPRSVLFTARIEFGD